MDVFKHWELQRELSTMRRLQDENLRLRRQKELGNAVALAVCIIAALIFVGYWFVNNYGGQAWNVLLLLLR